jgi:FkbM family methyltransferase
MLRSRFIKQLNATRDQKMQNKVKSFIEKTKSVIKMVALKISLYSLLRGINIQYSKAIKKVHDNDFFKLPKIAGDVVIIDVGANIGQSIISFKNLYPNAKIVSVEPNPACLQHLRRIASSFNGDVAVLNCGIGNSSGTIPFFVPVVNNHELLQEGSFDENVFLEEATINRIGRNKVIKKHLDTVTIDSLVLNPNVIKIDVQGFEIQVLEGALLTIERCKPYIIIERDQRTEGRIEGILSKYGYRVQRGENNLICSVSAEYRAG